MHVCGSEAAPAHQERLEIIVASGHSASCCVLIINETARRGKATTAGSASARDAALHS